MITEVRRFQPLRPGAAIGAPAVASPANPEQIARGAAVVEARGFRLVLPEPRRGPFAYLAGSDRVRAEELEWMLTGPEVEAVICQRGGYGAMRTAQELDLARLAGAGRPLVGFSDVTALLAGLLGEGLCSIHGPNLGSLAEQSPASQERLFRILAGDWAGTEPLAGLGLAGQGRAEGFLVGGNLTILAHLVGTPWQPPSAGGIVFFEDRGEKPYRLDRCLTHLLAAGFFEGVRGVAVGRLDGVEPEEIRALVAERLGRLEVPILAGLPIGHNGENMALLVGGRAALDVEAGLLIPLAEP